MATPPRLVLDTGVVVSALAFANGRLRALRLAWQEGRIRPVVCEATIRELIRTLGYPKFALAAQEREDLLADYLPWCETVRLPHSLPEVPSCRDPADTVFLHLAVAAGADALVTGDGDLLALAERCSCRICAPAALLEQLDRDS